MHFSNVSILGLGHVDAPHRIRSTDIEERLAPMAERVGLKADMLSSLTGILERRYWDEGVRPSEVAAMAGEVAIADAGVDRKKIGVVINTSVCKDFIEPSVAAFVHNKLKLPADCLNFDVGNACLAFLNGIQIVGNMIERGQIEYGLVVDGEGSRTPVEATIKRLLEPGTDKQRFRDNFATLTLGSGSAAMVLCRSDLAPEGKGHKVIGGVSLAATEHVNLCKGNPDEMVTDASALLLAGLELAYRTWAKAKVELSWSPTALDEAVIHQVSEVHTNKFVEMLELDIEKVFKLYPLFGNIGPASIPIALSKSREAGRLTPGSRVGLLGIGSGLNCSMMEVVW